INRHVGDAAGEARVSCDCPFRSILRENSNTVAALHTESAEAECSVQDAPLDLTMTDRHILVAALVLERVGLVVFFDRVEKDLVDRSRCRCRTTRDVRMRSRYDLRGCHFGFT